MDRLAERAPVMAPDAMVPRDRARGAARARAAGHLDARSCRAGWRPADALRARPVHHDVRVRRRRDPGQHQRRRLRCDAPGADGARGRQGERGGHASLPPATRWGCAARTAPPGRWRTAMAATWWWWPAGSASRRCGRRSTSFRRSASGSASWCCCTARAGRRTSCSAASSRRWRRQLDMEIEVTVDHAGADWRGHVGVVTKLIPRLGIDADNAMALVCGPEVMMRFAASALQRHRRAGGRRSICRWSAT